MVLRSEVAAGAAQCDVAVIVAGLPEAMEGEGFDRIHWKCRLDITF